jgi:hypothetical protein
MFSLAISHGNLHLQKRRDEAKIIENVEIEEGCKEGKIKGIGIEEV